MKKLPVMLALVLAACSSSDADERVDVGEPGVEQGENVPALEALTVDEIDARQAAWADSGSDAYRYAIDSTCGCDSGGRFEVTVLSGEVVTATSTEATGSERYRRHFGQSVEAMFAMFREAVTVGAEEGTGSHVFATFDDDLGHPTAFRVRWTDGDDPYDATISGFASMDAADVTGPDRSTTPLVVSNQSFDHPDARIAVTIDGEAVVDGVFPVGDQHRYVTYDVPLEPGRHELVATDDSGARFSQAFELVPDELLYLALTHWTAEEPGQEPASFDLTESTEPLGFG